MMTHILMMSNDIDPHHIDTVYYDTSSSTLRDAALIPGARCRAPHALVPE